MITYTLGVVLVASVNRPGYVNWKDPAKGFVSVDPDGVMTYNADNIDANYQQFRRNGMALEITPGDDRDPPLTTTYVYLPDDL